MRNISSRPSTGAVTRLLLVIVIAGSASAALTGRTTAAKVRQTSPTLRCQSAKQSSAPIRIVVIGSSIASGEGASRPEYSWAGLYRSYLKRLDSRNELIDIAVPGYVSAMEIPTGSPTMGGRKIDTEHNITAALAKHPDAVIMSLTGNDAARGYTTKETMANFRRIVATANEQGVEVWVTTPTPRDLDDKGRRRLIQLRDAVKKTFVGHSVNFWTAAAGPDARPLKRYDSGDGVHPNNAGHRLLYNSLRTARIPSSLTCR